MRVQFFFYIFIFLFSAGAEEANRVASANGSKYYQASIVAFKKGEKEVHFYCSIHIGQKSYYETLNKWFKSYEAVLFEKVKGYRESLEEAGIKESPHELIAEKLNLKTQLECIDYKAENFIHADLTFKELKEKAQQKKIPLDGILNPQKMKQIIRSFKQATPEMMKQLYRSTFTKRENKDLLIIKERNLKCMEVLKEQIQDKNKVAVFFGAGHFKDMKKRIEAEGFEQKAVKWITVFKE